MNDHGIPNIANLSNGNAFVAWQSGQSETHSDIYGREFIANGTGFNNEFQINENTTFDQTYPVVIGLMDATVCAAWQGYQMGDWDIYGRIFSANDSFVSDQLDINQNKTADQTHPVIAASTDNNIFVAWQGNQTEDWNIYGRVFWSNGTALSKEFMINQVVNSDQLLPVITPLTNGNVFAAWYGYQTGDSNIYGRIFSSSGLALTDDLLINQKTQYAQVYPSIALLDSGHICIVWAGDQTGNWNIYGRIFSSDGLALSNDFVINQNTNATRTSPSVASLTNDNIFVTWFDNQTGNWNIYGRVVSPISYMTTGASSTTGVDIATSSSSSNTWEIVGGIAGGLGGLVTITGGIVIYKKCYKKSQYVPIQIQ